MLELLGRPTPTTYDLERLKTWPRIGCSIASLVLRRTYNIREVARIYADCGVTLTTVNLLSAEWPSMKDHHVRPFKGASAPWNLYDWNPEYIERILETRDAMNSRNIVVQWGYEELYRWSVRKAHPETPDARLGPFAIANNLNGVDYVGPYYGAPKSDPAEKWDATILSKVLPDAWSRENLTRIVPHLGLDRNLFLCGNEFPEKSYHQRVRDHVRSLIPNALVSVNRNEDTPGQYANHDIPEKWDFLNYHGHKMCRVEDLDRKWASNQSSVPTMRTLLKTPSVKTHRIVFSSDGARISDDPINPYDWDSLYAFAKAVTGYGCSYEHQSRAKLSDHPNLHMIEREFLTKLAKLRPPIVHAV